MKARLLLAAAAVFGVLSSGALAASSGDEDRLREQLRSTVLQLRELQDGQAALQAQKTAAEQERDALKAKVGGGGQTAAQARAAKRNAALAADLKQQLDKAQADLAQAQEAGRQTQAQLDQVKGLYSQASETLRQTQAERDRLQVSLTGARAVIAAAEAKNTQLTAVAQEILDAYARFSVRRAAMSKEPFTGLERVKLENIAQAYEDKVREARFDPRAPVKAP